MSGDALVAVGLGLGTTLILIQIAMRLRWATILTSRAADWHHTQDGTVPRLGGLALVATFLATELWIAVVHPELRAKTPGRDVVIVATLGMFLLGFWDDLRPLGPVSKLAGQVLIASWVCWRGIGIEVWRAPFAQSSISLGSFGPVLTVFWLVSLTNLINLIDGFDGLAGGISLMLMILTATVAHQGGNFELLACGMAGGLVGFLCSNFPPARIYLGDGGAYFLGFQIGLYSIANSDKGAVLSVLVAPLFVLALPVTDACLTLARRGLRGLPLLRPDRDHLHHRLMAVACSRRKLVLGVHALNFAFLLMGLAAFWSQGQWLPMLLGAAAVLLVICAGACRFSRRWFAVHRVVRSCLRMRGEVRYALSLARWLELESQRRAGPDELWPDLVFAADKLGFAALKLTLENGQKVWQRAGDPGGSVWRGYDCPNARFGRLEFGSPACPRSQLSRQPHCEHHPGCETRSGSCLANPPVFELISDLLAEAWNKAAAEWNSRRIPVRFRSKQARPGVAGQSGVVAHTPFSTTGPNPKGVRYG